MTFGERLKHYRKLKGLTQIDLADLCGWPPLNNRVSGYETGNREPTLDDIKAMAGVLGVSPSVLAFGDEPRRRTVEEQLSDLGQLPADDVELFIRRAVELLRSSGNKPAQK